MTSKTAVCR